jgi:hypothetical protein
LGAARKIFTLCNKKKDECIGNNHDAERMKGCIAYAVRQNCRTDKATMEKGIKTAIEHHFGSHEECGDHWGRVKPLEGEKRATHNH